MCLHNTQATCAVHLSKPANLSPVPAQTDTAPLAADLRIAVGQLIRRLRAENLFPLTQTWVLGRLDREGPASVSELAQVLRVRPQSMAQTVGDLEADAFVRALPRPRRSPPRPGQPHRGRPAADRSRPRRPRGSAGEGAGRAPRGRSRDDRALGRDPRAARRRRRLRPSRPFRGPPVQARCGSCRCSRAPASSIGTPLPKLRQPDRRSAACLVLALTALFALLASTCADAAPWSAPEGVSTAGGSVTWSRAGIDAAGDATAVWVRNDGSHLYAQAAERHVGGNWNSPVDLSAGVGNAESPAVAVDPAGEAVAAWKERLGGSEAIEASYKPAGLPWELRVAVEIGSATVETPAVAIDEAGYAVVIWRQEVGGNHVIFASSRLPDGSWTTPITISSSALNAEAPDVAMSPGGTAAAVWQSSSGATSVVESNSLPPGGSWTGEEAISRPRDRHRTAAGRGRRQRWVRRDLVAQRRRPGRRSRLAARSRRLERTRIDLRPRPGSASPATRRRLGGRCRRCLVSVRRLGRLGRRDEPRRRWRLGRAGAALVDRRRSRSTQVAMSTTGIAQVVWSGWNEATHNYEPRAARA